MSDFGNLGDFLPQTEVECRIHGCHNRVKISGEVAMQNIAHGRSPRPARLCDECYAKLQTLQDKEVPCSKPGCTGTWIWNRFQQLEAIAAGHPDRIPHGFCDKCREEMKSISEEKFPCRMKGCKNTWTLTAREKLALNGKPIPHRLCNDCFQKLNSLQDKELKCRVSSCGRTWTWNRYQQLEYLLAGKSLENPPARMCPECAKLYSTLAAKEVPCRIHGCKNSWSWSPFEQLEAIRAEEKNGGTQTPAAPVEAQPKTDAPAPDATAQADAAPQTGTGPKPPARMCSECYSFWSSAKDIEVPCKNQACKNTWICTRSMQLNQKIRGFKTPPPRYCEACAKREKELADREMPCSVPGCTGTWTYKKDEQLRDESFHRDPKPRKCAKCKEFLQSNAPKEVTCAKCGKVFSVSSMQQLLASLGNATLPQFCADCARQNLDAGMPHEAADTSVFRPAIYIPKAGPWLGEETVCVQPSDVTPEKIAAMAASSARVVCIGDEMTVSCPVETQKWSSILQKTLAEKFADVQVLNAGIAGSTTALTLLRLERDLLPFQPNLVIFSCSFADALAMKEADDTALQKLADDTDALVRKCMKAGAKALYWTPNPVDFTQSPFRDASSALDAVIRTTRKAAEGAGAFVVDARALFSVSGEQTSRKWMADWHLHNEAGATNIANWLKDQIHLENLLVPTGPLQQKSSQ